MSLRSTGLAARAEGRDFVVAAREICCVSVVTFEVSSQYQDKSMMPDPASIFNLILINQVILTFPYLG